MATPRRMVLFAALFLGIAFILGWGIVFASIAFRYSMECFRLGRYVQTTGTVRATDIQIGGGGGSHGGGHAYYTPVVWYDYSVGGHAYTGSRIYLAPIHTQSFAEAQQWITATTAAKPLVVWYDPASPDHALLSTAFAKQDLLWLAVIPVFALGVGSIMMIKLIRRLRSMRAAPPPSTAANTTGNL
ncbi:MAG TPA: DUF3592 domain-containing protein [Phycisphaerales bacterium]|nr:DUF3592 domain-containing protein [Phycisphaerales bacterium]